MKEAVLAQEWEKRCWHRSGRRGFSARVVGEEMKGTVGSGSQAASGVVAKESGMLHAFSVDVEALTQVELER